MKSMKLSKIAAFAAFLGFSAAVAASGGPSGPAVTYPVQGHIGEVIVNPYNVAPLTAVIRDGGYKLDDVTVKILPKPNGRTIEYKVSKRQLKTHAGVPVFGLYQDYLNTVEVSYTRTFQGKAEKFTDRYQFYAPSIYTRSNGMPNQRRPFTVEVQKVDPEFADRLYLVDAQLNSVAPQGARFTWNNPSGGALEWAYNTNVGIIDTAGEVRWWLFDTLIGDPENPWYSGYFMGFQQTKDGALTWGFGQRYVKYDLMGREIFNRRLPSGYSDFSHSFDNAQNGNSLLRVAAFDYRRADNKRVHTVRDVIVEIDPNGGVVDDWRLAEILDPYRSNVIKALDQGAVCLNIDASKAGQTLSAEDLAKQEQEGVFGDVAGVGPGRNWAHVNSVDYKCEGSFDWSWTQHTAWRIDEKSDKDTVYITVFDNGDARGMEQPALAEDKYTRGVIYKIDQKKMTVEQIWEVGKDLGHEYYSPVTGLCGYEADKNSVTVFYSTAGLSFQKKKGTAAAATSPHPYLYEYRWGETQPAVALKFTDVFGYQAFPISVKKAFTDN